MKWIVLYSVLSSGVFSTWPNTDNGAYKIFNSRKEAEEFVKSRSIEIDDYTEFVDGKKISIQGLYEARQIMITEKLKEYAIKKTKVIGVEFGK